jgi:penicillin amidase
MESLVSAGLLASMGRWIGRVAPKLGSLAAVPLLALTGCSLSSYVGYRIAPDYPRNENQTIDLPGLAQPALVYLDEAGVSHIHAQSEEDLLRATGFMQSRDRFFAMDMMRRFARGRIAELVGEQPILSSTTVDFDVSMRGWGMDKAVTGDAAGLDPQARRELEAFVAGINRAVELYRPIEYRLLGVDPEPWTLEDCFALGRLNAWSVTHNWHQELSRLVLALQVGLERASAIYGHDYWRGGTSIPATGPERKLLPPIAPELVSLFPSRPYQPPKGPPGHARTGLAADVARLSSASNAWVVASDRSASGKPILAGDPHMAHMVPSLTYQQHIKAPGIDAIGGTVAGIPYVIFGHNGHVAWGTTSAVADAIDLYIERVDPSKPGYYEVDGQSLPFQNDEHVIRVRNGSTLEERKLVIRRSRNGPILNDMYPGLLPSFAPPVAVKWEPGRLSTSIGALGRANRARTVEGLREALSGMLTPAASWIAADKQGTIAVFATGTVPVRKKHLGTFPVPGWIRDYDWTGNVDPMGMPHAFAKEGVFAHANNLMSNPERSDVFFQIDSAPSYRVDRILELLEETPTHHPRTMARIQNDVRLLRARRLLPHMLEDLSTAGSHSPMEAKALELLRAWDFEAPTKSAAAAIFFVTYREAVMAALIDEVDDRGFEFIMGQRYSTNVADLWFDGADHVVWDHRGTVERETRATVVRGSFRKAVAWLAQRQGPSPAAWQWGRVHDALFKHAFGSKAALSDFVNMPRVEVGGGLDSVWKSHFDLGHPETPFRAMAGPVYRMIIDLGDLDNAYWIVDTGASGWPGSPHYADQHELWKKGEYVAMRTNWPEIRKRAKAVLTLRDAAATKDPG